MNRTGDFNDEERKKMLLSVETREGLRMTSKWDIHVHTVLLVKIL